MRNSESDLCEQIGDLIRPQLSKQQKTQKSAQLRTKTGQKLDENLKRPQKSPQLRTKIGREFEKAPKKSAIADKNWMRI
jgi:hypothetical protein